MADDVSNRRRTEVIGALRRGTVPESGLDLLAVGLRCQRGWALQQVAALPHRCQKGEARDQNAYDLCLPLHRTYVRIEITGPSTVEKNFPPHVANRG